MNTEILLLVFYDPDLLIITYLEFICLIAIKTFHCINDKHMLDVDVINNNYAIF